jgi:thiamine transport system permease protein
MTSRKTRSIASSENSKRSKNKTIYQKFLKILGGATPIILIVGFILFPVISVLVTGVIDSDTQAFTFQYLLEVFSDRYYYKLFAFTLSQALLSTVLTVLLGLPIAYFLSAYEFRGRKILLTLFTVPFVLPSVLVGIGFLMIFGEQGLFGSPFLSIVVVHAFYNIPLVIQYFSAYFENFDQSLIETAKSLGSSTGNTFFRVYLPLFLQPIISAMLLTFNFCFMSFGIILLLGHAEFRTVEIQIFALFDRGEKNLAAALAIMQLIVTLGYLLIYLLFIRTKSKQEMAMETGAFPRKNIIWKQFLGSIKGLLLFIIVLIGLLLEIAPAFSIIINSFIEPYTHSVTLSNYGILFDFTKSSHIGISIPRAILNTFLFSLGAVAVAGILALFTVVAVGRKQQEKKTIAYEMIGYLPLAVSSITLSLGILQTFNQWNFITNNPWIFLIISQGLLGYPFVTRALLNGLSSINPQIDDAAKTLGAKGFYRLRKVYFPLLFPSLLAGIAFAFGLALGEFAIANFFYIRNNSVATLTVVLYKLRSIRMFGESSAVGVLLLLLSYISFFIIERVRGREQILFQR